MKKYISKSIEETQKIAHEWLRGILMCPNLEVRNSEVGPRSPRLIGLSGHLGAGKTAFVKCIAKELGITETITSPTYVIMKIYDVDSNFVAKNLGLNENSNENANKDLNQGTDSKSELKGDSDMKIPWRKLVHIDAYRLESQEELQAIDWEGLVGDKNNLIFVEWPENVSIDESLLEERIRFQVEGDEYVMKVESIDSV